MECYLPLPGRFRGGFPMRFVLHCDDANPAPDRLMADDLLHFQTLERGRHVVLSDVVRRGLLGNMLSTYCVSPAGRYQGMSPLSWGLVQGLQRSIATRRRASEPGRSEGRAK